MKVIRPETVITLLCLLLTPKTGSVASKFVESRLTLLWLGFVVSLLLTSPQPSAFQEQNRNSAEKSKETLF